MLSVAPLCWAGNIVLARGVADLIPPVAFAFWRWTLAFVLILPFTLRQLAQDRGEIARRWKMLFLLAVLGISSFNALLYTAVHTTTAINGALIQSTMPAVIVLLSLILYREKVAARQMGGVLMCILGACLVVLRGDLKTLLTMSFVQGDLLMVIAVVFYGLYSALLRRRPAIHPLSFLSVHFFPGSGRPLPRLSGGARDHRPFCTQPGHRVEHPVCGDLSFHRRLFLLEQGSGSGGPQSRRALHQPDPGLRLAALGLAARRVDPALSHRRHGTHCRRDGAVLFHPGIAA